MLLKHKTKLVKLVVVVAADAWLKLCVILLTATVTHQTDTFDIHKLTKRIKFCQYNCLVKQQALFVTSYVVDRWYRWVAGSVSWERVINIFALRLGYRLVHTLFV